jgi:hypothetical protein
MSGEGERRRFVRFGFAGCPDIAALLADGRTLWIECKAEGGRLSADQAAFRDLCQRQGVPWVLAESWDDVKKALGKS